jgi:hypothetical protein
MRERVFTRTEPPQHATPDARPMRERVFVGGHAHVSLGRGTPNGLHRTHHSLAKASWKCGGDGSGPGCRQDFVGRSADFGRFAQYPSTVSPEIRLK